MKLDLNLTESKIVWEMFESVHEIHFGHRRLETKRRSILNDEMFDETELQQVSWMREIVRQ